VGTTKKYAYSDFGKKIKKRLVDRNMTATELAKELGTTPQYLNLILHGKRSGKKYRKKIVELLDIPVRETGVEHE
jgi:transcriptional regulator with XRE-family HTH domain